MADYGTLRVTTPDGQVREYPIDVETAVVGRADGNQVVVDHVSVSRRHAALTVEAGRVSLQDLGSANGTFVGSQQLTPHVPQPIDAGQAIRFGDVEAIFTPSPFLAPPPPAEYPVAEPGSFGAEPATFGAETTTSPGAVSPGAGVAETVAQPATSGGAAPPSSELPGGQATPSRPPSRSRRSTPQPAAEQPPPAAPPPPPAAPSPPQAAPPRVFTPPPPSAGQGGGGGRGPILVPQTQQDPRQFIGVTLQPPTAPIAAGSPTTATLAVQNRGPVVDELTIDIADLPPDWVRVTRPVLPLLPGARDEVNIVIHPPRVPEATAGDHPFAAVVQSREHKIEVRNLAKFTILPFEGLTVGVHPVRSRKDYRVELVNEGNAPVTLSLTGQDDESALNYQFAPSTGAAGAAGAKPGAGAGAGGGAGAGATGAGAGSAGGVGETITLQPGEKRTVPMRVKPKKRRLFGKTVTKSFRIEARTTTGAVQKPSVDGQLQNRPPLQVWKWPLLALLALGLLGGGAYTYRQVCSSSWPWCGESIKQVLPDTPTVVVNTPQSKSPTAAPATPKPPVGLVPGGKGKVINSAATGADKRNCLAVRTDPVKTVPDDQNIARLPDGSLDRLCDNTIVNLINGPTDDGTYIWWCVGGVIDPDGKVREYPKGDCAAGGKEDRWIAEKKSGGGPADTWLVAGN